MWSPALYSRLFILITGNSCWFCVNHAVRQLYIRVVPPPGVPGLLGTVQATEATEPFPACRELCVLRLVGLALLLPDAGAYADGPCLRPADG